MAKQLASGSLGWLIQQMPTMLRYRLRNELARRDDQSRERFKSGQQDYYYSLTSHLRQITEYNVHLTEMKIALWYVLAQYMPLLPETLGKGGPLPSIVQCMPFWEKCIVAMQEEDVDAETLQIA